MKNLCLLSLFLISKIAFGQIPFDSISKKFVYEGVVSTKDSLSQEEIYKRGKHWITTKLYSADNMTQLNDKDFNTLTGTGHLKLQDRSDINTLTNAVLTFKFSIYCKNSKYKYKIDNFRHSYTLIVLSANSETKHDYEAALEEINLGKKRKEKIYAEINEQITALIEDLEKSMNLSSEKQNDW